jgi:hypothetical protein
MIVVEKLWYPVASYHDRENRHGLEHVLLPVRQERAGWAAVVAGWERNVFHSEP